MVEKVSLLGQILKMQILMDLHVLRSLSLKVKLLLKDDKSLTETYFALTEPGLHLFFFAFL